MMISNKLFKFGLNGLHANFVRNSSQAANSKIYEIRKYSIKPACYADFIKLTTEKFHLRTAHSKVVGYFGGEIGSLNQTIHVWEYDNYAHRTQVRAKLAQDPVWLSTYISKLVSYIDQQENYSGVLPDWCQLNEVNDEGGIYELNTFDLKPGSLPRVSNAFQNMMKYKAEMSFCDLVGVWYPDVGDQNKVSAIWRYGSLDERKEGNAKLQNDTIYNNDADRVAEKTVKENSILMSPFPWSPLQ